MRDDDAFVAAFANSAEAVEAFRVNPDAFEFVVTNLSMPGVSGIDLARARQRVAP